MDVFVSNWQVILLVLAALFVVTGVVRSLIKLAMVGVLLAVLGLIVVPLVVS